MCFAVKSCWDESVAPPPLPGPETRDICFVNRYQDLSQSLDAVDHHSATFAVDSCKVDWNSGDGCDAMRCDALLREETRSRSRLTWPSKA